MSLDSVPKDLRGLRACKLCSMVKSFDQFLYNGCDNCERYIHLKGNRGRVNDCTSPNFDGLISMMSNEDSWVAKWQRINKFTKGCYAVSVSGELPEDILDELRERGVVYQSRDTSDAS
ncbi:PREDICTED: transcription elongation factor SPT4-A-like [Amphimedon queenslandica]|uniref:Transcription elongation factor SPT4 n=2 Tax=Amphimedon queenslandica TaxID=400682 RepID=I1FGX4_AMPQE|nr:PREDICTED: transcription elongation factor SPT4-A-like [Amphimedon queenslandica]|eukprot:XP_003388234.1 PREDICTED: transcription elongation factor SPT4-A-like [Amphimedon queenslandica]